MEKLRERPTVSAAGLEFCVLTAARTADVIGAVWSEFDLSAKLWTVPPERMKGRPEHVVPLSAAALDVVMRMAQVRHGDRVVPAARLDKTLGAIWPGPTVHGFRSSFRDWAGDCTSFQREVVEAALAHAVGNAVEAAYRRATAIAKRRELMEAWVAYCGDFANGIRLLIRCLS